MEQIPEKDGFIAVTEASWFTPERPSEIEGFWLANYPEIDTIPEKDSTNGESRLYPDSPFHFTGKLLA